MNNNKLKKWASRFFVKHRFIKTNIFSYNSNENHLCFILLLYVFVIFYVLKFSRHNPLYLWRSIICLSTQPIDIFPVRYSVSLACGIIQSPNCFNFSKKIWEIRKPLLQFSIFPHFQRQGQKLLNPIYTIIPVAWLINRSLKKI